MNNGRPCLRGATEVNCPRRASPNAAQTCAPQTVRERAAARIVAPEVTTSSTSRSGRFVSPVHRNASCTFLARASRVRPAWSFRSRVDSSASEYGAPTARSTSCSMRAPRSRSFAGAEGIGTHNSSGRRSSSGRRPAANQRSTRSRAARCCRSFQSTIVCRIGPVKANALQSSRSSSMRCHCTSGSTSAQASHHSGPGAPHPVQRGSARSSVTMWNTCAAFDRAAVDDGSNDVVGCVAEHARRPTSAVVLPQLARLIPHHNGLTDGGRQ